MRRKVQHQPNGGSAWGQDQLAHFFHFQTHTRAPWRTRAVGSPGLDAFIINQLENKIVYRIARRCA